MSNDHVETFSDGLKHDQVERNSGQRVRHAKHFAACRLRCAVTVACREQQEKSLDQRFLKSFPDLLNLIPCRANATFGAENHASVDTRSTC